LQMALDFLIELLVLAPAPPESESHVSLSSAVGAVRYSPPPVHTASSVLATTGRS
jgi:hypothetical protein